MPDDIDRIRGAMRDARQHVEQARQRHAELAHRLVQKTKGLAGLHRVKDAAVARESGDLETLQREYDASVADIKATTKRLLDLQRDFIAAAPLPDDLFRLIGAKEPLLLAPVRLETRIKSIGGGKSELLIRIYPDAIHSDTHEPELNEVEADWGKKFSIATKGAATETERKAAWTDLASRFGPRRAAWVAIACEPTDDGQGNLTYPGATRTGTWTRAPRTRLLPDRWIAILYAGSKRVVTMGEAISDTIALGPSPTAQDSPSTSQPELPPVDDGMRWMVEFSEAQKSGMGIRVDLAEVGQRIDRVLVVGIKASLDSEATAKRIEDVLAAHHYTDGAAVLLPGTQTNNTTDRDAAYRGGDGVADTSYALERGSSLVAAGDGSDGDRLALALGIGRTVLGHVAGADGLGWRDGAAMNAALWPLYRYYLAQMMADSFSADVIAAGWSHFLQFVAADGPLPLLLAGTEPYGVLPVTTLDDFSPAPYSGPLTHREDVPGLSAAQQTAFVDFLKKLRTVWRASIGGAPRIGRTGDPERDMAELLGQGGRSTRYAASYLVGGQYWINLWSFLGLGASGWDTVDPIARAMAQAQLQQVGVDWEPRLLDARFWGSFELNGPHVLTGAPNSDDEVLSESDALADNYITWLLGADIQTLRDERYPTTPPPNALLYLVLRHATLLALTTGADAAARLGAAARPTVSTRTAARTIEARMAARASDWREAELIDVDPGERTPRIWDRVEAAVTSGGPAAGAIAEDVFREGQGAPTRGGGQLPHGPELDELRAVAAGLKHLEQRPTAVLDRAMEGTFDLGATRLDAWISSFATKRLMELRSDGVSGIRVGGYGWLVGLRPQQGRAEPESGPNDEPVVDPTNLGFVHAPSIGQAATAAVLRAGYMSHSGETDNRLAINLDSRRVRLARYLLEGVRQGQSLGALLGYRLERGLHDAHAADPSLELDKFIAPFRKLAPLTAGKRDANDQGSVEAIATSNVVDGMRLLDLRKSNGISYGDDPLPAASSAEQAAIASQLDTLADAVDAVSDAVVAEGVHQLIQGNPARAGATLESIASGEAAPPELHVARTPRTGIGVTHRVLLGFSRAAAPAAISPTDPARAREDAEPELHDWASTLFGAQDKIVCNATFKWRDVQGNAREQPLGSTIKLSDLNISALDFLYIAAPSEQQERGELDQRVGMYALQNRPGGVPANARVELDFARSVGIAVDQFSFAEVIELARASRDVVGAARAIDARDLSLPDEADRRAPGIDLADLKDRADRARSRLDRLQLDLDSTSNSKSALRTAILATAVLGVQGAVPVSPVDDSVVDLDGTSAHELKALQDQADSIKTELLARQARIDAMPVPTVNTPDSDKLAHHLARLAEVLGRGFKVLPRFATDAAQQAELASALGDSTVLQDNDPRAASTWFERAAHVRAGVGRFETVVLYGAALGRLPTSFKVAQLPYAQGDRWIGLPPAAGRRILGGRLSIVLHGVGFNPAQSLAGLLIDDWVEVVPSAAETTGITFHFDAPGAEPPQALLIAVHPKAWAEGEGSAPVWDLATLEKILLETLDLAALRGVDLDALKNAGQFLPASFFADNSGGDTVATDFRRNVGSTPKAG